MRAGARARRQAEPEGAGGGASRTGHGALGDLARVGRHRAQVRPRAEEREAREDDLVHHALDTHLEPGQQDHVGDDVLRVDEQRVRDTGAHHAAAVEVEPHAGRRFGGPCCAVRVYVRRKVLGAEEFPRSQLGFSGRPEFSAEKVFLPAVPAGGCAGTDAPQLCGFLGFFGLVWADGSSEIR